MADATRPLDDRPLRDREARRTERARVNRLSRLPFLYEFALQSRAKALLSGLVQVVLVLLVTLVPAKLLTGDWLPPFVGFVVLAVGFAVQAVDRYLNAKAGRR